ncbi:CheR family methyltransferase [Thioclava sp. GXIMD2076]|uniref:Chemotaxis protein methyltransferase n=1 Tax=Thioclava kandeliae TaxID=3070818 RepID=A0ABV1SEU0_9RHOB
MNLNSVQSAKHLYHQFTSFVQDEIGVQLGESKRTMVESRLRHRMAQLGHATLDSYLHYLFEENALAEERAAIFDAVTTNKTDFFREPAHFNHLMNVALPEAVERKRLEGQSVKLWSAAASSGAEAWTIAFCAATWAATHREFRWSIVGTDINREVLDLARMAIYRDALLEPVPQNMREAFLMRGTGRLEGQSRVIPSLRRHVRFHQMNLLDDSLPLDRDVDVAFLRNVLIYFSPADQTRVIRSVTRHISLGGYLYLGHSESMMMRDPQLEQTAPAIFRKIG